MPISGAQSYPRVLISAGEHSGDRFGAALAESLRAQCPDVQLIGLGGPRMRAAGVRLLGDTVAHAGMGFFYTLKNFEKWARLFRRCVSEFNARPPDVFVPIDNPGFNLRVARAARERGVPVCYYVSPQVWAWLPHRIHRIGRLVDRMMTILPFEKPLYDRIGVDCRYVGHPILDYMPAVTLREEAVAALRQEKGAVVGLLPGSRTQEVRHTFPIIAAAATRIRSARPDVVFHVAAATQEHVAEIRAILESRGLPAQIHVGRTAEIMKGSRLCLVVSGTATLETAWFRTPMVVVYRAAGWMRPFARRMLHVKHISLVNILAEREVAPEFLKFDDDGADVAEAALAILQDDARWQSCRTGLDAVIQLLGAGGSCHRAAEAVLDCMSKRVAV